LFPKKIIFKTSAYDTISLLDSYWHTFRSFILNKTKTPSKQKKQYLAAIMDWYNRYVLAWELSTTPDTAFYLEALDRALAISQPEIFNTDQGSQFTSLEFTQRLEDRGVQISMDGRGRVFDNLFVERLWRSVKYEEVYLHQYRTVPEAQQNLARYFRFYNQERLHEALGYDTPSQEYVIKEQTTFNPGQVLTMH
jgi:putative transposase